MPAALRRLSTGRRRNYRIVWATKVFSPENRALHAKRAAQRVHDIQGGCFIFSELHNRDASTLPARRKAIAKVGGFVMADDDDVRPQPIQGRDRILDPGERHHRKPQLRKNGLTDVAAVRVALDDEHQGCVSRPIGRSTAAPVVPPPIGPLASLFIAHHRFRPLPKAHDCSPLYQSGSSHFLISVTTSALELLDRDAEGFDPDP